MRIGVFCSGGDAPGMNACIRAVVRDALSQGHEVWGIVGGYQGLLEEHFFLNQTGGREMTLRSVSGWAGLGGTQLKTSRSDEFRSEAGVKKAAAILQRCGIDALIPIGGDGTFHGAVALGKQWPGLIVGCPGTIDNDLIGADRTIGFSTAVQTAVDAVDKIRVTAESHQRMFLIEVMGRYSGYIAVYTAIAAGAEAVCIPEKPTDISSLLDGLHAMHRRGKQSIMLIVAEGDEGGAEALYQRLNDACCPYPMRVSILGHLQRGGAPTAADRILASRLGRFAVSSLEQGASGMMAGVVREKCQLTPFEEAYATHKPIRQELLDLIDVLSN